MKSEAKLTAKQDDTENRFWLKQYQGVWDTGRCREERDGTAHIQLFSWLEEESAATDPHRDYRHHAAGGSA